jgi:hypothetical protein
MYIAEQAVLILAQWGTRYRLLCRVPSTSDALRYSVDKGTRAGHAM